MAVPVNTEAGQASARAQRPSVENIVRPAEIPELTGIRFFAAFAVFAYHCAPLLHDIPWWLHPLFDLSGPAVSFFFMLSGMVLSYVYARPIEQNRIGWGRFMQLRLARVYPLHLFALLMYTIPGIYLFPSNIGPPSAFAAWVLTAACLQVYVPFRDIAWRWNGPSWSIACELFFYAVCPALIRKLRPRLTNWRTLFAASLSLYIADLLLNYAIVSPSFTYPALNSGYLGEFLMMFRYITPMMRLPEFIIGVLLGLTIINSRGSKDTLDRWLSRSLVRNALVLISFGLFYAGGLVPWDNLPPVYVLLRSHLGFMPACWLLILSLAWGRTAASPVLASRPCLLLGEASYSLYLLHPTCLFGIQYLAFHDWPPNSTIAVCALIMIGISILAFRFIETPARRAWRQAATPGAGDPFPATTARYAATS